jgi:hypothetical protein
MKKWLFILLLPGLTVAAEPEQNYSFGVSDQVVSNVPETVTDWLLNQQRDSRPAEKSEISAPIYVDTQRRLADSFRTAIPDTFGEQTRDE